MRAALRLATVEVPDRTDLRSSPLPTSLDFALTAASAASSKQARDVIVLDVSEPLVISDYFVICSGNSDRQVRAIAEEVERACRAEGARPLRREGEREASLGPPGLRRLRRPRLPRGGAGLLRPRTPVARRPGGRPQRRGRQPRHRLISPSLPSRTSPAQTTLPVAGRGVKERTWSAADSASSASSTSWSGSTSPSPTTTSPSASSSSILSALLAIFLWPLVLLGVDLRIR